MTTRKLSLYDYQREAMASALYHLENKHKRVILELPTGGGKTETAAGIIMQLLPNATGKFWFVVERLTLVEQAERRLKSYGLPVGVLQADRRDHDMPVVVASAQTLKNLPASWARDAALVFIDEAHIRHEKIIHAVKDYGAPTIGLTATPLRPGMGDDWQAIINVASTDQLTTSMNPKTGKSFLTPLRIFPAREDGAIKMAGEDPESKGEWSPRQVRKKTDKRIIGEIVKMWEEKTAEHFGGPVPTLVFTADTQHGQQIVDEFNESGHNFAQGTYRDNRDATAILSKKFQDGEYMGLASVNKYAIGYDHPAVRCIIGARPYMTSIIPLLQSVGRAVRPDDDKLYAIYLDCAENTERWWPLIDAFWADGVHQFRGHDDSVTRDEVAKTGDPNLCPHCNLLFSARRTDCPQCGWVRPLKIATPPNVPGIIEEVHRARLEQNLPDPDFAASTLGERDGYVWMHVCQIVRDEVGNVPTFEALGRARWYYQAITGAPPTAAWPFSSSGFPDAQIIAAAAAVRRRYADMKRRNA